MLRQRTHDGEALAARLAEALQRDGTRDFRDEAIVELLDSIGDGGEPFDRLKLAAILIGLARRVETAGRSYPNLIQAAAELAEGYGGNEQERAVRASKHVIRPLAESYMRAE